MYYPSWEDFSRPLMAPALDSDPFIFQTPDPRQQPLCHPYTQQQDSSYIPAPPLPEPFPDPIKRVPCRWGNDCHILLDDVSAAGLMRHIKEYHLKGPWNKKTRGTCEWDHRHHRCGREMAYASFGKHVAVVHLRANVKCPYCDKDVRRPGLLERHILRYCPITTRSS
ncbi:hypothetical protein BKA93DRAFT_826770 [Sparassis latifolia]